MATALTALVISAAALHAQWPDLRSEQRSSSGSWSDCAPGISVDFESQMVGELNYLFVPEVELGGNQPMGQVWSYYDGEAGQYYGSLFPHQFPTAGEHGVCLTVSALHAQTYDPCTATTCKLIDVVPDTSCLSLVADFIIAGVNGQEVTFQSTSSFYGTTDLIWDQDGLQTIGTDSPVFSFADNGPHRICLTVIGPPPFQCTRTVCKWLYMGPGEVPCDTLMEQGFFLITYEDRFVCVLDTSRLSGMDNEIEWDFGDGNQATGRFAAHAYSEPGVYQLCGTVTAWGPLVSDSCVYTHCVDLEMFQAASIDDPVGENDGIRAWPNPFTGMLHLEGLKEGPALLRVFDALGREVFQVAKKGGDIVALDLGHLGPGAYLLRCDQAGHTRVHRLMRE